MWDGKDSSGNLCPPGTYKFEAQATYADGTKGLYTLAAGQRRQRQHWGRTVAK